MALARTDQILHRIERDIRTAGKTPPDPDVILDAMNQIQKDICQKALAYKFDDRITLDKGVDTYDLGRKIFQLKSFIEPASWVQWPTWWQCWKKGTGKGELEIVTSTQRWRDLQLSNPSVAHPIAVMVWNERLRLFPAPSVTGEELYAFMYLLPSKPMELGNDPELNDLHDNAIQWGALRDLIGGDFREMYNEEVQRLGQQGFREITDGTLQIDHWSRDLGF